MQNQTLVERDLTPAGLTAMRDAFAAHDRAHGNIDVERERRITHVLEQNNAMIGCASGLFGQSGTWFYLTDMFVNESHRGQGLGSQLLRAIEASAFASGATHGWVRTMGYGAQGLSSKHGYAAQGFYIKQGYEVFFELPGWYASGHSHVGLRKMLSGK